LAPEKMSVSRDGLRRGRKTSSTPLFTTKPRWLPAALLTGVIKEGTAERKNTNNDVINMVSSINMNLTLRFAWTCRKMAKKLL
jgi:hypothetical protein